MEQLLADGQVRARRFGAGAPVVLLHSLLADSTSWHDLVPYLTGHAQVIVIDLPGFCGLPAVTGGLGALSAVLCRALAELALPSAPMLVGNGFGSFLALRIALDQPEHAGRLALLGCGTKFSDPGRAAFAAMREAASARGLAAIADTAMARLFGAAFRADHQALVDARRAAFLRTDPAMFTAACRALETLDLDADIKHLACKMLLLVGSEDQATPPSMAEALAVQRPAARLAILQGLAHVPQLQDPALIGEYLVSFMAA